MTNLVIENFELKEKVTTSEHDNWEVTSFPGRFLSAVSYSADGMCKAKIMIDEEGYEFKIVSLDRNDPSRVFKVLKHIEKKVNTYNGCGRIRLSGGPVSKRWGAYDSPVIIDFKEKYGINKIKRLKDGTGFFDTVNEMEEILTKTFIVENSDGKQSKLYIPKGTDARYMTRSKPLLISRNVEGPDAISTSSDMKICLIKKVDSFFIFEEKNGEHMRRTLYVTPHTKIFDMEDQISEVIGL